MKLFALVLCFGVVQYSNADIYDDARYALEEGKHETAVMMLEPIAKKGDAKAQNALGKTYEVIGSEEEAVEWYKKAVEQGFAPAQHNLGYFYYGKEVVNLWLGQEPSKEILEEALELTRKAAEQGYALAQSQLALMYTDGLEPDDYIQAYAWNELALMSQPATWGEEADRLRDQIEKTRDQLTGNMSLEQVEEAKALALNWSNKFNE